jgi:NodT family efflux transporter outer membrane factor (OMF) lipoprotein
MLENVKRITMRIRPIYNLIGILIILFSVGGCKTIQNNVRSENKSVPVSYKNSQDTMNLAQVNWRSYFSDENLVALIDTALKNNQELNIMLQEIEIGKNEIRARKGEYLPFVRAGAAVGVEKVGRYTRSGAVEEQLEIKDGRRFPDPLGDYYLGVSASWEVDIWRKLRNAKKSAVMRYLASTEGRNFMVTNLIAEISEAYYELEALDNQLEIIRQNTEIQAGALRVMQRLKESAIVTQLAVNRFQAQLLNTQNLQYDVLQRIAEVENRIHFLTGKYPQPIKRNSASFSLIEIDSLGFGVPSQLLANRPDIRQAEYELAAAKLDVKVARANFYPSLDITAGVGFQSFNAAYLLNPHSILYNIAGDLMAPLINRNAIKAAYNTATAQQLKAVYNYEQKILNAYVEVLNQVSMIDNSSKSYATKAKEVDILMQSINISNNLFNSARADYGEVLLTQREALESKMELIEVKMKQLKARVNIYRALGGGGK